MSDFLYDRVGVDTRRASSILGKLAAALVTFDPRFEILPGTAGPASTVELSDYEVGDIGERGE